MSHIKVLVVDDDATIAKLIGGSLPRDRYKVSLAFDAVTAISSARREKPDVIVLDIGLPGGGGFTVLERFRAMRDTAGVPIVVFSGDEAPDIERRTLDAGANAYVAKGAGLVPLTAAIRTAAGDAAATPGPAPQ